MHLSKTIHHPRNTLAIYRLHQHTLLHRNGYGTPLGTQSAFWVSIQLSICLSYTGLTTVLDMPLSVLLNHNHKEHAMLVLASCLTHSLFEFFSPVDIPPILKELKEKSSVSVASSLWNWPCDEDVRGRVATERPAIKPPKVSHTAPDELADSTSEFHFQVDVLYMCIP